MRKLLLLCSVILAGCVSNPADMDQRSPETGVLYGSRSEGFVLAPKAAQVSLLAVDDEHEVIQLDLKRPRYVAAGKHRVKVIISVLDRSAMPAFEFIAEAGRSYRFTAVEASGGFELTATDFTSEKPAIVFKAQVAPGQNPKIIFTQPPPWEK